MKLWFKWVGKRIDEEGISFFYGILVKDANDYYENYIVEFDSKNRLPEFIPYIKSTFDLYHRVGKKQREGYTKIHQFELEENYSDVLDDIEMQIMMERLQQ